MNLFCHENRQFKTTAQYALWDFMKIIERDSNSSRKGQEEDEEEGRREKVPKYRIINMVR